MPCTKVTCAAVLAKLKAAMGELQCALRGEQQIVQVPQDDASGRPITPAIAIVCYTPCYPAFVLLGVSVSLGLHPS